MLKYFQLFSLFIIIIASLHLDKVEIVPDSRGGITIHINNTFRDFDNPYNFTILPGYASIEYTINNTIDEKYYYNKIILNKYQHLEDYQIKIRNTNLRQDQLRIPVLFDQKLTHFLAPIQYRGQDIDKCLSKRSMLRYMEHISYAVRLMTGNTSYFDEKNSFIPDGCFPCNSTCMSQDYGIIMGQATDYYYSRNPEIVKLKFNTRFFFSNWPGASWLGMGQVPSINQYVSKSSYWTFVRANYAVEEEDLGAFCTIIHESSHNMGFSHAATGNYGAAGFLKGFTRNDNYADQSSYMGNNMANKWFNIPGPVHFHNVIYGGQEYYKPWYMSIMEGKHVYRILAWDYPYTRPYLGVEQVNLWDENEIIDGVPATLIRAALIINYNKDFNTAQNTPGISRVCFEYHWYPLGLYSYQNKGIKATIASDGMGNFANLLTTTNDDIATDNRGELPLGYLKVPEVDVGTMKFKILRFHPVPNIDPDPNMLFVQPEKLTIKDIPYVDIEIEYTPYKPYLSPPKQIERAEFDYSSTIFNCILNNELYTCSRTLSQNYYWIYIKDGIARKDNLPRLYDGNNNNIIMNGRLGVISFPGENINSDVKFTYGKMDREKIRSTSFRTQSIANSVTINFYKKCKVYQRNGNTGDWNNVNDIDYNKEYDIVYYSKYVVPNDARVVIEDIYKNNYPYQYTINDTGIIILPRMSMQGFTDLFISIKNDTYVYNNNYIRQTQENHYNRVAFIDYDYDKKVMKLSSANIFPYKSSTSIIGPLKVVKDVWHYFIFTKFSLKDYILFDFIGKIDQKTEIQIETENGIYIKEIGFLSLFEDISLRINVLDIANITGGWGEIYKYRFNNDVNLLSIRPVLVSSNLQQLIQSNEQNRTIRIGTSDLYYSVNCTYSPNIYSNDSFVFTFKGHELLIEDSKIVETDIFNIPKQFLNNIINYSMGIVVMVVLILFSF